MLSETHRHMLSETHKRFMLSDTQIAHVITDAQTTHVIRDTDISCFQKYTQTAHVIRDAQTAHVIRDTQTGNDADQIVCIDIHLYTPVTPTEVTI